MHEPLLHAASVLSPRSMPIVPLPVGRLSETSHWKLMYHRPRASGTNAPALNSPSISRDIQKQKLAFEVDGHRAIHLQGRWDKRNPSKFAARTGTGPEPRASSLGIARRNELPANRLNRIAVQSKIGGGPRAQLDQVERGRPAGLHSRPPALLRFSLDLAAIVPSIIHRARVPIEILAARRVLDTVFVCEHHAVGIIGLPRKCKDLGGKGTAFPGLRHIGMRHQVPLQAP